MGRVAKLLAFAYAAALVASWFAMGLEPAEPPAPTDRPSLMVAAIGGDGLPVDGGADVRVAYFDEGPEGANEAVLLLHGSPGSSSELRALRGPLAEERRVLTVDLPGFGASQRAAPDYSVRAHAGYVLALLDALEVERVHAVGFSMGGGVALELYAAAPERVASLTMLAALGVEELELLGDHQLNHGLHLLQVGLFRAARWLVPHFGRLDGSFLGLPYARNFADTDQRRLRGILESFAPPALVLHGEGDFLVPVAAAREHARIVPQAELVVLPEPAHHFLPWEQAPEVVGYIDAFLDRADAGAAPVRSTAAPERLARANEPFDPASVPPFEGPALFTVLLLLAVATLVSEDLACIGAGLLVADGRLSWVAGSAACFVGIFVGDMLLYLLGRAFGRAALHRRPLSWIASEEAVERASRWFDRKGIAVIFLSRFTPGLRLPTYVAAGVLRTSFARFALFFAVAGLIWTPALVGIAALAGEQLAHALGGLGARQLPWLVALVLGLLLLYRNLPLVFTHRGRRILRGRWLRLTRWEFWPPWITYLPVLPHVAWLGVRHGGLAKCTAANPALPAGGFVGESKSAILEGLGPEHPEIPDFALLRASDGPDARAERARAFVDADGHLPVVLKPDAGQRGSGVALLDRADDAVRHARELEHDAILQQVVHGPEFGVFWVREPGAERGRVFSVTVKQLPEVVGDGRRTVEELLLDDPRACAMHGAYLAELGQDAEAVLPEGEVRRLVEVGTHARGAIFLDGEHLRTPALEEAVERIASRFEGFHFGRFDVIAPSEEAFAEGVGLRVIELNGVTSESTNVYDPKFSVLAAYRTLWAQWTLAYRIGAANAALGAPTVGLLGILQELRKYRKGQAQHLKLPHEILSRP